MEPEGSLQCSQEPSSCPYLNQIDAVHTTPSYLSKIHQKTRLGPRSFVTFCNKLIVLNRGVLSPTPNPPAGGPPLVGCLQLLIQYIRSYLPHLEAVSSIRNLRTRHVVVTKDPPLVYIGQQKHRKKDTDMHTYPCPELKSNQRPQCSCG
jgi:hypothetical protein